MVGTVCDVVVDGTDVRAFKGAVLGRILVEECRCVGWGAGSPQFQIHYQAFLRCHVTRVGP